MSALADGDRRLLLDLAHAAIARAAAGEDELEPATDGLSAALAQPGACFVTLRIAGALRGCVGTLEPRRPLVHDVAHNAHAAALRDTRFRPLAVHEVPHVRGSISILGALQPLGAPTRAELEHGLRPGIDGLVIAEGARRATFLPAVWAGVAGPREFLDQLLRKLGRDPGHWSAEMTAWRYEVEHVGEEG